jgi:hypothetical protein
MTACDDGQSEFNTPKADLFNDADQLGRTFVGYGERASSKCWDPERRSSHESFFVTEYPITPRDALQIIDQAIAYLERGWCRGAIAVDKDGKEVDRLSGDAVKWSPMGALCRAALDRGHDDPWWMAQLVAEEIDDPTRVPLLDDVHKAADSGDAVIAFMRRRRAQFEARWREDAPEVILDTVEGVDNGDVVIDFMSRRRAQLIEAKSREDAPERTHTSGGIVRRKSSQRTSKPRDDQTVSLDDAVAMIDRAVEYLQRGWCHWPEAKDEEGLAAPPWWNRAVRWSAGGALSRAAYDLSTGCRGVRSTADRNGRRVGHSAAVQRCG